MDRDDLEATLSKEIAELNKRKAKCAQCQNPMLKGVHTCVERNKKERWERVREMSDEELIEYCEESDHHAKIVELIRRYKNKKKECQDLIAEKMQGDNYYR